MPSFLVGSGSTFAFCWWEKKTERSSVFDWSCDQIRKGKFLPDRARGFVMVKTRRSGCGASQLPFFNRWQSLNYVWSPRAQIFYYSNCCEMTLNGKSAWPAGQTRHPPTGKERKPMTKNIILVLSLLWFQGLAKLSRIYADPALRSLDGNRVT